MPGGFTIICDDGSELVIPAIDYGSRFIDARGHVNWLSLAAESRTASLAAHVLANEAWDRSTDDEINAILFEHDIDPAQIADYRADIIAIAKRARRNAYYDAKCRREPWRL
ncbi:MAG: hypothetical protein P4M05_28060 [Bradyrhizobium sp.]|nr:hypothetical protein [Bradyrhizobium sp.]